MRRGKTKKAAYFLLPLAVIVILLFFFTFISGVKEGQRELARTQIEETVRRTALTCYALEGAYPPDLEYMNNRYGLGFDEERYQVYYDVYGSNLMPDITVLEKGEE